MLPLLAEAIFDYSAFFGEHALGSRIRSSVSIAAFNSKAPCSSSISNPLRMFFHQDLASTGERFGRFGPLGVFHCDY